MKILMHSSTGYSWDAGVSRVVLKVGNELEKMGLDIEYVFGSGAPSPNSNYYDTLQKGKLSKGQYIFPLTPLLFLKFIRKRRYDIVHSHAAEATYDSVIARIIGRLDYRNVMGLHGLDNAVYEVWKEEIGRNMADYRLRTDLYYRVSLLKGNIASKYSDQLTGISTIVRGEAKEFLGREAVVVPNGVDTDEFNPEVQGGDIRKRYRVDKEDVLLLFVGNNIWRKGLLYLIDAVKRLGKGYKLLIIGLDIRNSAFINSNYGSENIFSLGEVPNQELRKYYTAADVTCLPALNEPFGLVVLESMASGTPCIASRNTGCEDFILDGKNGLLVKKRDTNGLVEAIERLRDIDYREKLGREARRCSLEYSWKNAAKKTLDVYDSML